MADTDDHPQPDYVTSCLLKCLVSSKQGVQLPLVRVSRTHAIFAKLFQIGKTSMEASVRIPFTHAVFSNGADHSGGEIQSVCATDRNVAHLVIFEIKT